MSRVEMRLFDIPDLAYLHRWFSGRMLACHAGGPGSIPGRCNVLLNFSFENTGNN